MAYEGGEIPISFMYWDLPVALAEIKFGDISVSSKLGEYLFGSGHWFGIEDGDVVESSIVDTDLRTPVGFLHHHDW